MTVHGLDEGFRETILCPFGMDVLCQVKSRSLVSGIPIPSNLAMRKAATRKALKRLFSAPSEYSLRPQGGMTGTKLTTKFSIEGYEKL